MTPDEIEEYEAAQLRTYLDALTPEQRTAWERRQRGLHQQWELQLEHQARVHEHFMTTFPIGIHTGLSWQAPPDSFGGRFNSALPEMRRQAKEVGITPKQLGRVTPAGLQRVTEARAEALTQFPDEIDADLISAVLQTSRSIGGRKKVNLIDGDEFKKLRLEAGMTQEELAHQSDVNTSTVQRAENRGEISAGKLTPVLAVLSLKLRRPLTANHLKNKS